MDPVIDEPVISDEPVAETPVVETPAVVPPVEEKVEPVTPPTMEETIRAKFRELNKPIPGADETPPEGQMRGPDGRWVEDPSKKAKPAVAAVAKPAAGSKAADGAQPVVPAVAKTGDVDVEKAPTSWKGGAQAKYAALDPEIKAEIHRRETDFHKGIEGYKAFANIGQQFHAEFQPYEALIRASGHTPQSLVKNWMNTEYKLKTASPDEKAELFLKYAKDYGISMDKITEVATKIAAGEPVVPPVDPRISVLEQSLKNVTSHIENAKTEAAQKEYKAIEEETIAFGQKPENKHFQTVKLDMAALMESGRATDLSDAYNKAIWANPETRAILQAEQQATERAKAVEKAAAARKAAGANVATRGTLPAKAATPGSGTMDDTIRQTLRAINARTGAAA